MSILRPAPTLRKTPLLLALTVLAALTVGGSATSDVRAQTPSTIKAGAARVDSTWHVGAAAGQYASDGTSMGVHGTDVYTHSTRRSPSWGMHGREWVRALVVEGTDGQRYAVVTNDLYIPQDLVNRRVAGILAQYDLTHPETPTGITPENLTISVSHSHSSPYYSTPSWGVWAFQDVFDIRYFEHIAQRMAEAVIRASTSMVPARMGAATYPFTIDGEPTSPAWIKKHSYGPATGDDGSPAGYPRWDTDRDLSVLRFDDMSNPAQPAPLATWVVWGLHPENLEGNDLLTTEYVNTLETILDREIGGVTLFSQNDTGTAEAIDLNTEQVQRKTYPYGPQLRPEYSHHDYAQMEREARILADGVKTAWQDVATKSAGGSIAEHHRVVPFSSTFTVGVRDLRLAPPGYRPYPTVSNCRTENTFEGNPGIPIVPGLPDCTYIFSTNNPPSDQLPGPVDPGVTYDMLKELCHDGVAAACVPDNVGAPSYTGLQETLQVHLQAVRLGDVAITICPCEQWADQSRNIKSRLDKTAGNLWYGWDYTANYRDPGWQPGVIYDGKPLPGHGPLTLNDWCVPHDNGTAEDPADDGWACKAPSNPDGPRRFITDEIFRRMKAQIYNDAAGWDALENAFQAETEPRDPDEIMGNFTHEELTPNGYDMVVTVGMSNDYWGYLASYREFQRGDHYRKALTGLGPHSQDYMATRLSRMAASMNGGPAVTPGPKDLAYTWDYYHQFARQQALGASADSYLPAYEAELPPDGGTPAIAEHPGDVERFSAATVSWVGGGTFHDTPRVVVERCVQADEAACDEDSEWQPYGNGFNDVQARPRFPSNEEIPVWRAGQYEWRWTASFEAFDSDISLPDVTGTPRTQTPEGVYRFVIDGCHRRPTPSPTTTIPDPACDSWDPSGRVQPYHLVSEPFQVRPWDGITVEDLQLEGDETVSFRVGPVFPYPHRTSNMDEVFDARFGGSQGYEDASPAIDYPDTYEGPFDPYLRPRQDLTGGDESDENDDVRTYDPEDPLDDEVYCFDCSFRPWADTGAIDEALVTIRHQNGTSEQVPASYDAGTGRWRTDEALEPGDTAFVDVGDVNDTFGEYNGVSTGTVSVPCDQTCDAPGGGDGQGGGQGGQGGGGVPALRCNQLTGNHIRGTDGRDRLRGTSGRDIICGFGGRDRIRGLAGDDVLLGGPDADLLIGGRGFDLCHNGGGGGRARRCEDGG